MATTSRAPTRTSLRLPRPIEPTKSLASEPCGPQTANLSLPAPTLHLFARASCSKQRRPPQPNLHSPNSRPAVQCNEGFCNADGQRLTLITSTASQKPHHYANGLAGFELANKCIFLHKFCSRNSSLVPNKVASITPLKSSVVFVSFANERSRFRPLMLWRTCGALASDSMLASFYGDGFRH